ncbi:hypothetical protein NP233_g12276 [Leucocoprinus birnbaumii]|uniref:Uncharacterized protein n=1 Tax=Leucocoprinus birnbaumii TaxID=56174 RepID=A0AAD5VEW4_9AGAR|nr:hypothetical protein NP233_g12276 [Leucocoprinus birnbaumii]
MFFSPTTTTRRSLLEPQRVPQGLEPMPLMRLMLGRDDAYESSESASKPGGKEEKARQTRSESRSSIYKNIPQVEMSTHITTLLRPHVNNMTPDKQWMSLQESHTPLRCSPFPPLEIELTPRKTSALAPFRTSPALKKGRPNEIFRPTFGDEELLGEEGVIGDLGWLLIVDDIDESEVSDELSAGSVVGDTGVSGTVSASLALSDGATISGLTDDLRIVGKARVSESGRGLLARGVDEPDCGGVATSPDLLERGFATRNSCEPTLSLLLDFALSFSVAANSAALFGCRQELEVFGLGPGDALGDTPGETMTVNCWVSA